MRAIDADALAVDIKECIEAKYDNCEYEQVQGLETALECIDEQPTAVPERKTGRWVKIKESIKVAQYRCSECGRTVCDDRGYDPCVDYPYCHCGARTEGE